VSVDPRQLPYHLRHTGLFIGYAPADAPRIAIAVAVEHGGYGGSAAAPIAKAVFDAWLLGKMPEPREPAAPGDTRAGAVVAAAPSSPSASTDTAARPPVGDPAGDPAAAR
jgi:penicillin-binding protein 2